MRRRARKTVSGVRAGVLAIAVCACVLVFAGTAGAAEPWLAQMPAAEQVVAKTRGENASDTAARQWVAFDKLSLLTDKLLRDRMLEGTGLTPDERAIKDRYGVNRDGITKQQQTNLTAAGFSEWRKLADRYWADPGFNDSLLTLFSSQFRADHKQILRETFEGAAIPGATPTTTPTATPGSDDSTPSEAGGIPAGLTFLLALLAGIGVRLLLQRARLELDPRDPFRLLLGGGTYVLNHATGSVDGASKMGTTNVYGGGGGANAYGYATNIRISSTTTIHDQFFLRKPDGAVESIQLAGWDFPVADGHVVSAVWAVREGAGAGPFFVVVNHTTKDTRSAMSFLTSNLSRADRLRKLLVFCFLVAVGVGASQVGDSAKAVLLAVLGAIVGVMVGSGIWHSGIKLRMIRRFQRDGMPRIQEELHQLAVDAAPVPA